jgi:hypothetical protein
MKSHRDRLRAAALGLALLATGCSGGFSTIAPAPPEKFTRLGHATGTGCGTMFVISTAYNIFPVMLGGRAERAYANAVASVPGATALIDVTLSENWYWWVLGTTRCTRIEGEAIK